MPAVSRPSPPGHRGLVLREARSTDIDALAKLEAECFSSDRLSRRSLVSLVRSPSAHVVVAIQKGIPIGSAVLLTRRGGSSARLYSIAVSPGFAGRGVGAQLLRGVEDEASRRGVTRVHLEVRADNAGAIRFYERAGYRQIGKRPGYYADGATALLFARELSAARAAPRPQRLRRAA